MAQVIAASLLTAGLRSDFVNNYGAAKRQADVRLGQCMLTDVKSDKLTEIYGYPKSAPHMRRWPRGWDISQKAFGSVQFSVTNKDWGHRIPWHRNDRMDDQTGSLFQMAQQGGKSAGVLDERVFFQILTGATDADLLESIPTAPDGAALYATVDGASAARFGATNGNLLTGNGVATASAIRGDIWSSIQQFKLFQDTEGQPLFTDAELDEGFVVVAGAHLESIMTEALLLPSVAYPIRNVAGAENVAAVAAPNSLGVAGKNLSIWHTQRITTNDIFVFMRGCWVRPIFSQLREPLQEEFANMDNDSLSRRTGEEYIQWHFRKGYGVNLPIGTVKIDN